MAKAKKTETPNTPAPAASAAKPAAPKKAPAKSGGKKPAAAKSATPTFNTFAAESAARMIGAKLGSGAAGSAGGGEAKKESSAFKQLKQSLTKPHAASVGNLLNSTISPAAKKGNQPFQGGRQVGHNQTFGSDASKNFVPRRTGG